MGVINGDLTHTYLGNNITVTPEQLKEISEDSQSCNANLGKFYASFDDACFKL
jgi:hypothetical protein